MKTLIKGLAIVGMAAAVLVATAPKSEAGMLGCLTGAAAGGFGGSKIGKGNGQLLATGIGTLLGCVAGDRVQNYDGRRQARAPRYEPRYAPRYEPRYEPRRQRSYDQRYDRRYSDWRNPDNSRLDRRHFRHRQPAVVQQANSNVNFCPYTREYQTTVTVGGREVPGYGNACSYDGGQTWKFGPARPTQ